YFICNHHCSHIANRIDRIMSSFAISLYWYVTSFLSQATLIDYHWCSMRGNRNQNIKTCIITILKCHLVFINKDGLAVSMKMDFLLFQHFQELFADFRACGGKCN